MPDDPSSIIDPSSGLFSEAFLRASLPTRVATARRAMKQLGLITIRVNTHDGSTPDPGPAGGLIRETLRDSDTGVLLDDGRFALLLEFTPVEGCVIIANRLADRLREAQPGHTMAVGIASYPVHAINATELLQASARASRQAEDNEAGAVVVAPIAD